MDALLLVMMPNHTGPDVPNLARGMRVSSLISHILLYLCTSMYISTRILYLSMYLFVAEDVLVHPGSQSMDPGKPA